MYEILNKLSPLTYYRGRVALYSILKGLGIGNGDQVILQAFTCVAVPEAIMAAGAQPLYVDISPNGFNMSVDELERTITPQTRAIIVQHTYGIPADMEQIKSIADNANIPIIEDCCHTFVSKYKGELVGSFGAGSFYSFEWGKPIVAGIGGSAMVNDPGLLEKIQNQYHAYRFPSNVKLLRIQLQYLAFKVLYRPSLYWPVRNMFHLLGYIGAAESNYNPVNKNQIADDFFLKMPKSLKRRMTRKFSEIAAITEHSRWVSNQYQTKINSAQIYHPEPPPDSDTVFARYPLLVNDKKMILENARKAKVELAEWYTTPVHPLTDNELSLVGYHQNSCPNAQNRCDQVVTLPTHMGVKKEDVEQILSFFSSML
jgi:dTDP-4-amino-4,6-dideoxygalactose transaminase